MWSISLMPNKRASAAINALRQSLAVAASALGGRLVGDRAQLVSDQHGSILVVGPRHLPHRVAAMTRGYAALLHVRAASILGAVLEFEPSIRAGRQLLRAIQSVH